jgi:hypothetical protein
MVEKSRFHILTPPVIMANAHQWPKVKVPGFNILDDTVCSVLQAAQNETAPTLLHIFGIIYLESIVVTID